MVTIFSADWTIDNYILMNRNSTIIPISTTQMIISHLKQLNTKKTVTYVGVNQGDIWPCNNRFWFLTDMYIPPIYTINIQNIPPINTINILYIPLIHTQSTCIYHPYAQSKYMYIPPIYTINILYIPSVYTINIHVYTTHIHNQHTVYTIRMHNQYTCIYHPYTQSL